MEDDEDVSPVWIKANDYRVLRRRASRRIASVIGNSGVLLAILLVIGAIFVAFVVPVLLSIGSKFFRPDMIKKTWDSLNLVLVLFAVICGVLTSNGTRSISRNQEEDDLKSFPTTPMRWFEGSVVNDGRLYHSRSLNRLRSYRSYPDFNQLWSEIERTKFHDDTLLWNSNEERIDDLIDLEPPSRKKEASTKKLAKEAESQKLAKGKKTSRVAKTELQPQVRVLTEPPSSPDSQLRSEEDKVRKVQETLNSSESPCPPLSFSDQTYSSSKKVKPKINTPKHEVVISEIEDDRKSTGEIPWIPVPPPPPKFNKPVWKLIHEGDFVRLASIGSSDDSPSERESPHSGEETVSPDVNVQADNFIARERADRTLESFNSVIRMSNLHH